MKPFVFCALAVAFGIITLQSVKSHHANSEKHCHHEIEVVPYPLR